MTIIKNASLVQLNIRKHGSLCLRDERSDQSTDQRDEREFFILGRLFEKM